MTELLAVDTSVAIPLLVRTHDAHAATARSCGDRPLALSGHALVETYSVLTRLPGDLRADGRTAADVIARRFAPPLVLTRRTAARLPGLLADLKIVGGAVYDALVALAARDAGRGLATRDAKALATYTAVGVEVEVLG